MYDENQEKFWYLKNEILKLLNERIELTNYCFDKQNYFKNTSPEIQNIINVNEHYFKIILDVLKRAEEHNNCKEKSCRNQ